MDQAWTDALKALPGAAIVGIPLMLAVRALWTELKSARTDLVTALVDKIKSETEWKALLEKIAERVPRAGS